MHRLLRRALIAAFAVPGGIIALPLGVSGHLHAGTQAAVPVEAPQVKPPRAQVAPRQDGPVSRLGAGGRMQYAPTRPQGRHALRPAARPVQHRPPGVTIVIPRLGIRAPVYERGVDPTGQLPIAPGYAVTHFAYSAPLGGRGNYVIYGHDDIEGSIFEYLGHMQVGDRIYLYSGDRRVVYRVMGSRIVQPDTVSVLDPTPTATLTMISCTPYGVDTQRIVVKAALVERD